MRSSPVLRSRLVLQRPASGLLLMLVVGAVRVGACTRENPGHDPDLGTRCPEEGCPDGGAPPVATDGGTIRRDGRAPGGDTGRPNRMNDGGRPVDTCCGPDAAPGPDGVPPGPDAGGPDAPGPDLPPDPICEPGTPVCIDATRAALCDQAGTGYAQVRTCKLGTECRAGVCRDPSTLICTPGEPVCIDEDREATCDAQGTGYTNVRSCTGDEICRNGACRPPDNQSCVPGDSYCDSTGTVVYCPNDGMGYVSYTCSQGYSCSMRGDYAGCFRSASCSPNGQFTCDGSVLVRCSGGTSFEEISNCENSFGLCLPDPANDGACCENVLFQERVCCNASGCTVTSTGSP